MVVVLAVIIAAIRFGDFYDMHLIGYTLPEIGAPLEATKEYANLEFGYWLACAAGPLLVVLTFFRNKIIGKAKLRA